MSLDSEDLLLTQQLHDNTIITVRGSSDDVTTGESAIEETTGDDGDCGSTHDGSDNGDGDDDDVKDMDTTENPSTTDPPAGSTGDINTEDLTEFEDSMKKLEVTGKTDGPKVDSGKRVANAPAQTDEALADVGMMQLFETCSMIQTRQNSNFPSKPPNSCLMDAQTVSYDNIRLHMILVEGFDKLFTFVFR